MSRICGKISIGSWCVVALYLFLWVLYFSPINAPYKLTYPLILLSISSIWRHNPLLTLALICSAVGDYFGTTGELICQIGAFGLAQLFYLLLFVRQAQRPTPRNIAKAAALPTLICIVAFVAILPHIGWGVIKVGVLLYALLLGSMCTVAGMSQRLWIRVGAILFMLSDLILAQALFVSPIPSILYLSLYFAGQLLLWIGATSQAEATPKA